MSNRKMPCSLGNDLHLTASLFTFNVCVCALALDAESLGVMQGYLKLSIGTAGL